MTMTVLQDEGTFMARAISASRGEDDKGYMLARVNLEILSGPGKGSIIAYNGRIDAKSAPYVAKDLAAIGWKGKTLDTLAEDVKAARAEVPIEIQHKETKDGTRKFAIVRSIGRGALSEPTPQNKKEADDLLSREFRAGAPAPATPPGNGDDIPFISSAMSSDIDPIAKVLR